MTRRARVGFDRRIDLAWLDAAAAQAAADAPAASMRAYLHDLLEGVLSGGGQGSARAKTVTVLQHIWGPVPERARPLRGRACVLIESCTAEERLALHWAMMVATYPIFTDLAAAAGRLLTLQGSFNQAHLTRRLVALWGERSTVERAARRILRSMIQWGALRDTATAGIYEGVPRRIVVSPAVGLVLLEALLLDAEDAVLPLDMLLGHPALFPFELETNSGHLRDAPRFSVHRQGLDADVVELRGEGERRSG